MLLEGGEQWGSLGGEVIAFASFILVLFLSPVNHSRAFCPLIPSTSATIHWWLNYCIYCTINHSAIKLEYLISFVFQRQIILLQIIQVYINLVRHFWNLFFLVLLSILLNTLFLGVVHSQHNISLLSFLNIYMSDEVHASKIQELKTRATR